ncbi:ABC transporter permease [Mycoplasmopsis pullorum]|uniref:ABC transporter permease n=1 Tax=Mycoplasmopsis pullorum TaxID=48003 RepID=UPI00111A5064|nr:ABC transporter permease [Mycoplasmopsis pullorum]TNK82655.1 ABC transporter permease [Mycoplasmopsis pullorum]TNK83461.1 ABC transporter permease [Mycoplasmopsis pullorum]TNK85173.1 ABC transporter permease [Mycoplasmopsis pullorum]TNK85674.1 ABC transporter permease [Mycoplasmopsis pullorum]TNK85838.1 ABC transporter permease [Mycoplasmopsis pullorum]
MSSNDFNSKYGLSSVLIEESLVFQDASKQKNFNNIAGQPKKIGIEILKRFFSNWVYITSAIVFLLVLIISIVVKSTAVFSPTKAVYNDVFFKGVSITFDANNKVLEVVENPELGLIQGPNAVSGLPSVFHSWSTEQYTPTEFNSLKQTWMNNWGGYLFKEFVEGNYKINPKSGTVSYNTYALYKAHALAVILTKSGVDTNISASEMPKIVDKIIQLNPNLDLKTYFGTTRAGVDIWTSSWIGTWNAIRLALIVATLQTIIGVAIGSYLGFHVGTLIDTIIMRLIDIFVSPPSLIWLLIFASLFGTSDLALGISLVFIGWTGAVGGARMFIITVKDEEYITASRSLGSSKLRLIYSHALPAIAGKIATGYVSRIPSIILSVSSLAFLGFFKSNSANLGAILNDAAGEDLSNNLWAVMLPALILLSISISLHFVALGVHDALDPKVMKAK